MEHCIKIKPDYTFYPKQIEVNAGDTIVWELDSNISRAIEYDIRSTGDVQIIVAPLPSSSSSGTTGNPTESTKRSIVTTSIPSNITVSHSHANGTLPDTDDKDDDVSDGHTVYESLHDTSTTYDDNDEENTEDSLSHDNDESSVSTNDNGSTVSSSSGHSLPSTGIPLSLDELPALGIGFTKPRKRRKKKKTTKPFSSSSSIPHQYASLPKPTYRSTSSSTGSVVLAKNSPLLPTLTVSQFSLPELSFDSKELQLLHNLVSYRFTLPDSPTLRNLLVGLSANDLVLLTSGKALIQLRYHSRLYPNMKGSINISLSPVDNHHHRSSVPYSATHSETTSSKNDASFTLSPSTVSSGTPVLSPSFPTVIVSPPPLTPKRLEAVSPHRHRSPRITTTSTVVTPAHNSNASSSLRNIYHPEGFTDTVNEEENEEETNREPSRTPSGLGKIHESVALLTPLRSSVNASSSSATSHQRNNHHSSPLSTKHSPSTSRITDIHDHYSVSVDDVNTSGKNTVNDGPGIPATASSSLLPPKTSRFTLLSTESSSSSTPSTSPDSGKLPMHTSQSTIENHPVHMHDRTASDTRGSNSSSSENKHGNATFHHSSDIIVDPENDQLSLRGSLYGDDDTASIHSSHHHHHHPKYSSYPNLVRGSTTTKGFGSNGSVHSNGTGNDSRTYSPYKHLPRSAVSIDQTNDDDDFGENNTSDNDTVSELTSAPKTYASLRKNVDAGYEGTRSSAMYMQRLNILKARWDTDVRVPSANTSSLTSTRSKVSNLRSSLKDDATDIRQRNRSGSVVSAGSGLSDQSEFSEQTKLSARTAPTTIGLVPYRNPSIAIPGPSFSCSSSSSSESVRSNDESMEETKLSVPTNIPVPVLPSPLSSTTFIPTVHIYLKDTTFSPDTIKIYEGDSIAFTTLGVREEIPNKHRELSALHKKAFTLPSSTEDIVTSYSIEIKQEPSKKLKSLSSTVSSVSAAPSEVLYETEFDLRVCNHSNHNTSTNNSNLTKSCTCVTEKSLQFRTAGVYQWQDSIYSFMKGRIVVLPESMKNKDGSVNKKNDPPVPTVPSTAVRWSNNPGYAAAEALEHAIRMRNGTKGSNSSLPTQVFTFLQDEDDDDDDDNPYPTRIPSSLLSSLPYSSKDSVSKYSRKSDETSSTTVKSNGKVRSSMKDKKTVETSKEPDEMERQRLEREADLAAQALLNEELMEKQSLRSYGTSVSAVTKKGKGKKGSNESTGTVNSGGSSKGRTDGKGNGDSSSAVDVRKTDTNAGGTAASSSSSSATVVVTHTKERKVMDKKTEPPTTDTPKDGGNTAAVAAALTHTIEELTNTDKENPPRTVPNTANIPLDIVPTPVPLPPPTVRVRSAWDEFLIAFSKGKLTEGMSFGSIPVRKE